VGGPLLRDRLWFFTAHRHWGASSTVVNMYDNLTPTAFVYTPDLNNQALNDFQNRHHNVRLTWQASKRNKVNFTYDWQYRCDCHRGISATLSPEASAKRIYRPNDVFAVTWNFPVTNRLLLEAGSATVALDFHPFPQDGVPLDTISVLEQSTNLRFRAGGGDGTGAGGYGKKYSLTQNTRFTASYITGGHSFKSGIFLRNATKEYVNEGAPINYTVRNGIPQSVTLFAYPIEYHERLKANLGLFVQDQWTVNRLTLNLGLRYDYLNAFDPETELPAGPYVPARQFAQVGCVPCWSDLSPRISASYDLFGNGKTAIKVGTGKYMGTDFLDLAHLNHPLATANPQATRSWVDRNNDFEPQESELGPLNPSSFGTVTIVNRYGEEVLKSNRSYNWATSASIQHELRPGLAVNFGYFRTSWHNFQAQDNLAVNRSDYDPFCITAPANSNLPDGGAYQLCGLFNIVPGKFGLTNNLVTTASSFGEQSEVYNGVDLTVRARFASGAFAQGGLSTGSTVTDNCYQNDDPSLLASAPGAFAPTNAPRLPSFCHVSPPWSAATQLKLSGAYPLPWALQVAGTFQNLPGIPVTSIYNATNTDVLPSLGRSLSGGAQTVPVALIAPQTMFEDRINQLDLRLTRTFRLGRARLQGSFDVYNVLNGSSILAENTTYGPSWRRPTAVLDARLFKFGGQLTF
jgi:hypothetical protein